MTLNAVTALILRFSLNSTDFQADYITVVEEIFQNFLGREHSPF